MKSLTPEQWRSLLDLFVADADSFRLVLMKPFEQNGFVCATDGHNLIRVSKEFISGEFPTPPQAPNVARVIPAYKPSLTVSVYSLRHAFVAVGVDYNRMLVCCPECDGDRQVEWEYTDIDGDRHTMSADCPVCDGSGQVLNGVDKFCIIADTILSAYSLLLLHRVMDALGIDTAQITFDECGPLLFTLADGVDILIAPCPTDFASKAKTIVKTAPSVPPKSALPKRSI